MVVMMANTPELTPEPQDFPPVASTSLLEPTNNVSEGAPPTAVPAIDTEEIIYTNIRIFEQFVREYDQQVPPAMPLSVNPEIEAVISRSGSSNNGFAITVKFRRRSAAERPRCNPS